MPTYSTLTQTSRAESEFQAPVRRPYVSAGVAVKAALQLAREAAEIAGFIEHLHSPIGLSVTHYGESYNGHKLGCGQGMYTSTNPTIVAVGPEREAEWPCGTLLQVCGPGGCQLASRQDGCPGCSAHLLDLSEAGIARVCGPGTGVCRATAQKVAFCPRSTGPESEPAEWAGFDSEAAIADPALLHRDNAPGRLFPEIGLISRGC